MSRRVRWANRALGLGAAGVLSVCVCSLLWADQRPMRSKAHNYANAPVTLSGSKAILVETFATPSQSGIPGSGRSRIPYVNRKEFVPSTLMLAGEVVCTNTSTQAVEAVKLTLVLLDAFHGAIGIPGQQDRYAVKQLVMLIPRQSSKSITWEQRVDTAEIYEIAAIITGVRFADGSVWLAPSEELIDVF